MGKLSDSFRCRDILRDLDLECRSLPLVASAAALGLNSLPVICILCIIISSAVRISGTPPRAPLFWQS